MVVFALYFIKRKRKIVGGLEIALGEKRINIGEERLRFAECGVCSVEFWDSKGQSRVD